jgi:hypothetical protein
MSAERASVHIWFFAQRAKREDPAMSGRAHQ